MSDRIIAMFAGDNLSDDGGIDLHMIFSRMNIVWFWGDGKGGRFFEDGMGGNRSWLLGMMQSVSSTPTLSV
jgi:hypothetical protein